jgi:hypothetical protein
MVCLTGSWKLPAAINAATGVAKGKYLLFLSDKTEVQSGFFKVWREIMQ